MLPLSDRDFGLVVDTAFCGQYRPGDCHINSVLYNYFSYNFIICKIHISYRLKLSFVVHLVMTFRCLRATVPGPFSSDRLKNLRDVGVCSVLTLYLSGSRMSVT